MGPMPKALAISNYNSKLRSKTSGGYKVVEMNYEADDEKDSKKKEEKKPEKESVKDMK